MDNKAAIFTTDFPWPLNWVTVDLQNLLAEYSHNNYACIIILLGSFFFSVSNGFHILHFLLKGYES